ncbi:MAG: cyclase [Frankiales bacterium]|nr:cyclase [Frankiales bacterium]
MVSSTSKAIPRALGVFSLGLGALQLADPRRVNDMVGLRHRDGTALTQRAVGVQELTTAAGLLGPSPSAPWLWNRVAGDIVHAAMLRKALNGRTAQDPARTVAAIRTVAGLGVVDLVAAVVVSRQFPTGRTKGDKPTAKAKPTALHVSSVTTINHPADELYAYWRDIENLPTFMTHLNYVEAFGDGKRSHWIASAPAGRTVEWDAEITDERPGELLAWRSLPGAAVDNSGTVTFTRAPQDRGTEVRVELTYSLPGGRIGSIVAKLFGEEPQQQVADDLKRFKQVIETGEVVVSDGNPVGTRTSRQVKQRPGQPVSV